MNVLVVIPTYGRLDYLGTCVASVLRQTYDDCECVVVNDDRDVTLYSNEKRVHCVNTRTRMLLPDKRNLGVGFGRYDLYMPLDDDDVFLSERVERRVELYEGDKNVESTLDVMGYTIYGNAFKVTANMGGTPSSFTRRAFLTVGGYEHSENKGDDWEFMNKLRRRKEHRNTKNKDYVYAWSNGSVPFRKASYHTSFATEDAIQKFRKGSKTGRVEIVPDYEKLEWFEEMAKRALVEKSGVVL